MLSDTSVLGVTLILSKMGIFLGVTFLGVVILVDFFAGISAVSVSSEVTKPRIASSA